VTSTVARMKPSARMEEILARAAELFYEKGYHATTIEDVARKVGMLKGSLYYYIRSKEDLLYELLLGIIVKGVENASKAIDGIADPTERLEKAVEAQIEHIIQNQTYVGLFLHEFNTLNGKRQKRIQEEMLKYQKIFVDAIREGQKQGQFVEADTLLLTDAILGMTNWIYRWYPGTRNPGLDNVKKAFISFIMNGIKKR
jgi:TetR/AcrR family transcriptional regulator, cholesterol catabolism regulator